MGLLSRAGLPADDVNAAVALFLWDLALSLLHHVFSTTDPNRQPPLHTGVAIPCPFATDRPTDRPTHRPTHRPTDPPTDTPTHRHTDTPHRIAWHRAGNVVISMNPFNTLPIYDNATIEKYRGRNV